MKHLLANTACLALALVATAPAAAQTPQTAPAAQDVQPPADPARMAAAKVTVAYIFPVGIYAKLMNGVTSSMMEKMMDSMGQMPLRDIVALGGLKQEDLAKLGKGTIADIMAIMDPAYKQRTNAVMNAMMPVLIQSMTPIEPSIRDGLAEAYATKFSLRELQDMNAFFATPSGSAYAANAMLVQMDPAVMSRMTSQMPRIMQQFLQQMPAIMKKAEDATAGLPKARKYQDLSPAERARVAALLGVPEKDLDTGSAAKTPAAH